MSLVDLKNIRYLDVRKLLLVLQGNGGIRVVLPILFFVTVVYDRSYVDLRVLTLRVCDDYSYVSVRR